MPMSANRRLKRQAQIVEAKRIRKAHKQAWIDRANEVNGDDQIRNLVSTSAYSAFLNRARLGIYEVQVGMLLGKPITFTAKSKHELANRVREWHGLHHGDYEERQPQPPTEGVPTALPSPSGFAVTPAGSFEF